ncbi:hypothetical protein [Nocardia bovistercoris]|uniref:Integral membrane protein n=1 Tax=Nocardia bovistercoris TaxID=2785916 RepID=A0A931IGW7_9NOCA|nr:hypothetical protein [Nocardia bovistercoris]MBH0779448.1 hypothetical protein [Nocardia bovistercoris]
MDTDAETFLHGPLYAGGAPLDRANAAARISAYIYGNVLVLAALVPIVTTDTYVGIFIVLGTALSTFIAHVFAETVGRTVQDDAAPTRAERVRELRNSVPILTSALLPCAVLATTLGDWVAPRTAQLLAEAVILVRIGGIVFVIRRLRGERLSRATVVAAVLLTVAAATVVAVKVALTH